MERSASAEPVIASGRRAVRAIGVGGCAAISLVLGSAAACAEPTGTSESLQVPRGGYGSLVDAAVRPSEEAILVGSAPGDGATGGDPREDKAIVRDRDWYVTGFLMQAVEVRLPRFPYKALTGDLPFRKSYLASVAASKVVVPRFAIPLPFFKLRGNSLDLEGQLAQHFGHERSTEVTAAAIVRSGQVGLVGRTSANFAWGNGFSYALSSPTYEMGPEGIRGVNTVHLQYHMSFETEVTSAAAPRMHYVLRLHHRSGIYGVISPSRTGSNYLGFGLRFDLRR